MQRVEKLTFGIIILKVCYYYQLIYKCEQFLTAGFLKMW